MLLIRWLIDPMHVEVNVAKNLIAHLYGNKSSSAIREDAKDVGVVKSCWTTRDGVVPDAPWALPRPILRRINGMICDLKFPSHYGAGFRGCTTGEEWTPPIGLKSHDYHKLVQHVLPVVLRSCDENRSRRGLRQVIYDLCGVFRYTSCQLACTGHWLKGRCALLVTP